MILYPEYQGEPDSWAAPRLPAVPEKLMKEMESISQVAGIPRFRIVDGTRAKFRYEGDAERPAGTYLQYAALVNVQRQGGYMYADGEGWKKVSRSADVPSGKLAIPYYDYADFGIPRYMVEVYRDAREPGVDESGYVWGWTVDSRTRTVVAGEIVDISHFRMPSDFDIEHARQFLRILEMATKETIRASAEKFMERREKRDAEAKQTRREERAEATEKFIRDELL
jgi:hypothetical protein